MAARASYKQSSRGKPPEAGSCAGSSYTPCMDAGIGSTTTPPAGSSKAVHSVGNAGNEMPDKPLAFVFKTPQKYPTEKANDPSPCKKGTAHAQVPYS
eukprot:6189746-Pleurochrysis_carterae.AAC.2